MKGKGVKDWLRLSYNSQLITFDEFMEQLMVQEVKKIEEKEIKERKKE